MQTLAAEKHGYPLGIRFVYHVVAPYQRQPSGLAGLKSIAWLRVQIWHKNLGQGGVLKMTEAPNGRSPQAPSKWHPLPTSKGSA